MQNKFKIFFELISHNRLKQNDLCIFKFPNKNRIISIARLNELLRLQLQPIAWSSPRVLKRILILGTASLLDAFRV